MDTLAKKTETICIGCHQPFLPSRHSQRKFCSYQCYWKTPRELKLTERFFAKVRKTNRCWIWVGHRTRDGYGYFSIRKQMILAHRYAWTYFHQEIPKELSVLHRCDNPPCVNPKHLFLGTQRDNMMDMIAKGRGWWH